MVVRSTIKVDQYDKAITNCVEATGHTIPGKKYTPTNINTCDIATCTCTVHTYDEGQVDAWALWEKLLYVGNCSTCPVCGKTFTSCEVTITDDLVEKYDAPKIVCCGACCCIYVW